MTPNPLNPLKSRPNDVQVTTYLAHCENITQIIVGAVASGTNPDLPVESYLKLTSANGAHADFKFPAIKTTEGLNS